jgi:hypothetical protein
MFPELCLLKITAFLIVRAVSQAESEDFLEKRAASVLNVISLRYVASEEHHLAVKLHGVITQKAISRQQICKHFPMATNTHKSYYCKHVYNICWKT